MDSIAGRSTAEQIDILTTIKNQLSSKLRLAAKLQRGSDAKSEKPLQTKPHDDLREAVEQACADAKLSLSDKTFLQVDAVSLEIQRLEEKRKEIIEIGKRCEDLTQTIKKVQEYVAGELSVDSSRKRDRSAADLDDLSEEASATAEACKKFKGQDVGVGSSGVNPSKPYFAFVPTSSNASSSSTPPPRPFENLFGARPTTTSSTTTSSGFNFGTSSTSTTSPSDPWETVFNKMSGS